MIREIWLAGACLLAAGLPAAALAQAAPEPGPQVQQTQPATPPAGYLDVQMRLDDLVEFYGSGTDSFSFMLRDISVGYTLTAKGRGIASGIQLSTPRQSVDQSVPAGKEPRAFRIEKGRNDQPRLVVRTTAEKKAFAVYGQFVRSDWSSFAEGRSVTILVPVEDFKLLRLLSPPLAGGLVTVLRADMDQAGQLPGVAFGKPSVLGIRPEAAQVVIQGNRNGLTVSYPSAMLTIETPLAAPR
ncbi:hypothetical protein [Iodidimonas sp. SYSU 1G8]|uniref:hypothetical protein n=1 Tax=Iodidimonas sp. SYSU 1G8 TaxID=3133967 RepID=UPI0031FEF171